MGTEGSEPVSGKKDPHFIHRLGTMERHAMHVPPNPLFPTAPVQIKGNQWCHVCRADTTSC